MKARRQVASLLLVLLVLVSFARTARAGEPDRPASPPVAGRTAVFLRAYGGAAYGVALASAVAGPSGGVGLGVGVVRRPWGGLDVAFDGGYEALATKHDVGVRRLALGASGELAVWRLRFGLGVDVGSTWIARVSGSNVSAQTYYVGGHATAGVDLLRIEPFTLYVAARGELNAYLPSVGGSGGLRVAF